MRRLIGLFIVLCAFVGPAVANDAVRLDDALKSHVLAQSHIRGQTLNRQALDGKVVVLSFFASWCPPCLVEFAHLNELRAHYDADDVAVVAINLFEAWGRFEDDGSRLDRFLARTEPTFSVVGSNDATENLFGGVDRIPTVFVFDRAGRPVLHFIHAPGATVTNPTMVELRAAVDGAL